MFYNRNCYASTLTLPQVNPIIHDYGDINSVMLI